MKKSCVYLLLFVAMIFGCAEEQIANCENCDFNCVDTADRDIITNSCEGNWTCTFEFKPGMKVDLESENFIGNGVGDKNFFVVARSTEGDPGIADDEITYILIFDLKESLSSFSVEDAEFADLNIHFKRLCFCVNIDFFPVTNGCLQGELQDDGTWRIQGSIMTPTPMEEFEFKFDANFES